MQSTSHPLSITDELTTVKPHGQFSAAWLYYFLGLPIMFLVGSSLSWDDVNQGFSQTKTTIFSCLVLSAYLLVWFIYRQLAKFPKKSKLVVITITVTGVFIGLSAIFLFFRLYYSRSFLLTSFSFTLLWFIIPAWLYQSVENKVFTLIPNGGGRELKKLKFKKVQFKELLIPTQNFQTNGIVVDVARKLSPEWFQFLVDSRVKGIPVYHSAALYESLTGKVSFNHLSEEALETLPVSPIYAPLKRVLDILAVLLLLPLALPMVMVIAILTKLNSPGPVIYWQRRVGKGGKPFLMAKIRSMRHEEDDGTAKTASKGDPRITEIGKFIRKYRIDEIPQFWNVLKGDMSMIGPRPEQIPIVNDFLEKIPHYGFRHMVKPGITGWAQVVQGYSTGTDQTMGKVQLDLYYIKHFSVTLDLLIIFKTIRTILTGFGAR